MLDFFRAGGFNMFLLAGLGAALIATAVRFARRASAQRLAVLRALTLAVGASAFAGFAAGLASTARYVVDRAPADPLPALLVGFAESTANLVLGGGLLVIAWILVAVGVRRMPGDPS